MADVDPLANIDHDTAKSIAQQLREALAENRMLLTTADTIDLLHDLLQSNADMMIAVAEALVGTPEIDATDVVESLREMASTNLKIRAVLIDENQYTPTKENAPDVP